MNEAFLSYLWKFRLYKNEHLQSTEGEPIEVLQTGEQNHQAGPDFFNAKIKIGDTIWAGNVEIHTHASDWLKHQHQRDDAYDNVILHLVYEPDMDIKRKDGTPIPTLSLFKRIPPILYQNFLYLDSSKQWIPCQEQIAQIDGFTLSNWLDRLLIERLEQKITPILQSLQQNQNSWETTFYYFLARTFGGKVNSAPFELLAKSLPLEVLAKHKNQLFQVEALLFGQAGLLDKEFEEDYPNALRKEYHFLQKKFTLNSLQGHSWKFARMRPPNLPTIRIAQFANLIHQSSSLFSKVLSTQKLEDYYQLFEVQLSDYWLTHYVFDKSSKKRSKSLGITTINSLLINTVVPMMFVYGKKRGENDLSDKALKLLETLPPEKNSIIEKWTTLQVKPQNAFETQALLQLKNRYCDSKRCLECAIGNKLLRSMK
ncbi:MAG: DUF2851 family protein [Chitinophagales bacterium]